MCSFSPRLPWLLSGAEVLGTFPQLGRATREGMPATGERGPAPAPWRGPLPHRAHFPRSLSYGEGHLVEWIDSIWAGGVVMWPVGLGRIVGSLSLPPRLYLGAKDNTLSSTPSARLVSMRF